MLMPVCTSPFADKPFQRNFQAISSALPGHKQRAAYI